MTLPGRTSTGIDYRYGFNGMEKDDELKGIGNSYDFGARMLDPRVGRWFAVDPKRSKGPGITPYRFAFNNPIRIIDPDGKWEEDGHFWTVFAYGVSCGLDKATAFEIAKGAEHYDHIVSGNDYSMTITPIKGYEYLSWGRDGGAGTWAQEETQGAFHGLNGDDQDQVLMMAKLSVLAGNLKQIHLLGDAWSHSYINKEGERKMMGSQKVPFSVPILGRITLQHKFVDENGKWRTAPDTTDDIAHRPIEYKAYINSLQELFNNPVFKYNGSVTKQADAWFFDYVQENGKNKENNVFLLKSYIEIKSGVKEFSNFKENQFTLLKGYLDKAGIKYEVETQTYDLNQKNPWESKENKILQNKTELKTHKIKIK